MRVYIRKLSCSDQLNGGSKCDELAGVANKSLSYLSNFTLVTKHCLKNGELALLFSYLYFVKRGDI